MYYLQARWKAEGKALQYYGLRSGKNLFRNSVRLNAKQRAVIAALPKELTKREKRILGRLLGVQVVPQEELKQVPRSLAEARFCTECCANDFIIPGLEFDAEGRCPLCATREKTAGLKSILPLVTELPRAFSRIAAQLCKYPDRKRCQHEGGTGMAWTQYILHHGGHLQPFEFLVKARHCRYAFGHSRGKYNA